MSSLSLNTSSKASKKAPKEAIADSWEDEDVSGSETENNAEESDAATTTKESHLGTEAPPPTPASPFHPPGQYQWPDQTSSSSSTQSPGQSESGPRRPEKTDAVARRMIAAGLGLKAPKQSEEQKAYQRSIREQEKKKREQQREEEQKQKEETAKAKAAVWDD